MAISKKRTSGSRKRIRNHVWRAKAVKVASKAVERGGVDV